MGREAAGVVAAAERKRREGEAELVQALCDLAEVYRLDEHELVEVLCEQRMRVGAEGTPLVPEFLSLEVAALLGCSVTAAGCRLAEALNLKYRHPRVYQAVLDLELDAWVGLKVASKCRDLHPIVAETVTTRWLARQAKLGPAARFALLEKLIIEADPKGAAEKERAAREDRGVHLWGLDDGVMNLTGRLDVLDARFLDSRLDEVARLIDQQFPELTHRQRRAKALGVLANPAYATALLQAAALQPELIDQTPVRNHDGRETTRIRACQCRECAPHGPFGPVPPEPATSPSPGAGSAEIDAQRTEEHGTENRCTENRCTEAAGQSFDPHDVLGHHCGELRVPARSLRPSLGIVVHIPADSLGGVTGAARVERAGHITTELLAQLLGEGIDVSVQPVIDLPLLEPEDGYRPSTRMRRAVALAFPTEPFPYSHRDTRGMDIDHTVSYRAGPPGQTRIGNLAPLSRRVHRAKTAGLWILEQSEPGRLTWRSPLGFVYDVTPFGTRRLPCAPVRGPD